MSEHELSLAMARVEEKLDHLVSSQDKIGVQVNSVESRLREVEQATAMLESESRKRLPWPTVLSALCAAAAIAFVIAERMYSQF